MSSLDQIKNYKINIKTKIKNLKIKNLNLKKK